MQTNKVLVLVLLSLSQVSLFADHFNDVIKPYIKEYCIRCHGPEKQNGDRRYVALVPDFKTERSAILWRDILDQLLLEEMPPKKPFPSHQKHKEIINWITENFKKVR